MKKTKGGFSLAELLVVITIVGILIFGLSNVNYKPQIESQNAVLFTNEISSNIETMRNNSLLGKGITSGTQIIYPSKRIIKITSGQTGTILGYYTTGGVLQNYNSFNVKFIPNSNIRQLKCYDATKTSFQTGSSVDIEISGTQISFSGCSAPNNALLEINLRHANIFKNVRINGITGLIEKS